MNNKFGQRRLDPSLTTSIAMKADVTFTWHLIKKR